MEYLKQKYNELLNYENLVKLSYHDFTKYIRNTDNITKIKNFLNLLMSALNLNLRLNDNDTKVFLTSYMFNIHTDKVIQTKDDVNTKMELLANDVVFNLETLFTDYSMKNSLKYEETLKNYFVYFQQWKKRDSLIIIRPILKSYFELESLMNIFKEENNQDYLHIERKLKSLKNNIKLIAGKEGLLYLEKRQVPVFTNEKLYTDVQKTVHKAFWDVFEENIEQNNLEQIPKLLLDIKNMIQEMISNKDFLKTFDENIDLDLITNIINSTSDKTQFMFKLISYLLSLLYKLQPASEDKNTKLFEENIQKMFTNGEKTSKTLRYFFENYFKKLELIKKVTLYVKNNLNKNRNTKIEEI